MEGHSVELGAEEPVNRTNILWAIAVVLVLGGLKVLELASSDVAVLHTRDTEYQDSYTTLWVVEESRSLWIRAATPNRKWLAEVRPGTQIWLERDDFNSSYQATISRDKGIRERVDRMMREKYGLADRVRELVLGTDTVPVMLVPLNR